MSLAVIILELIAKGLAITVSIVSLYNSWKTSQNKNNHRK